MSVLLASLISLFFLKRFDSPYPSIALLWFAACVVNAGLVKVPWAKLLWLNAGSACLLFGAAEFYFLERRHTPATQEGTMRTSWMRLDDVLGYAPKAGALVTDRRILRGGELMWDVSYTIDDRGLRVTPRPDGPDSRTDCVLFFGDSFTFGTGVSDQETMPYQVAMKSAKAIRVFNFGVGGYGAHQMLSAIEHRLIEKVTGCDRRLVKQVIYQAIWQHAGRVAGLVRWDHHGPWYDFDETGAVIYRGHFDDGFQGIWRRIWLVTATQAAKSEVYRRVMGITGEALRRLGDTDLALYVSVVARTRELIHTRYPCASFHVLFWDTNEDPSLEILDRLRLLGPQLHRMSTILPNYDYGVGGSTYKIHPQDGHPNALAHELIADRVVETILPDELKCEG
jgi:hypothetical protein